ncbi:MAG: CBS domain-containing protein [Alkalibacterium sp.]|nr:CBS domain-containing protein [Alkalibacterium sp.]
MRNNYRRFMHAFNELQKVIAEKVGRAPDTHFGELLGVARKEKDKVIETYLTQIDFYRELRNILAHHTMEGGEVAAYPSDALIREVESVTEKIKYNKKVRDLFLKRVRTFDVTDPLKKVLAIVNRVRYTQFPVFDGNELVGMLSSIGVTKFFAKAMSSESLSISAATVRDILEVESDQDFYAVIPSDKSIFDIEELFLKKMKEGHIAYTLLITETGEVDGRDDLIGIITPWDIPKVVANK